MSWLYIENTPTNFNDFEFPNRFKVEMLTQAVKQDNTHIYPVAKLARDEEILEELHKALINQLVSIGFDYRKESNKLGIEVKVLRSVYILPNELVPLGLCVVEKRSINNESLYYYICPSLYSIEYLPRHITFINIIGAVEPYISKEPTNTSIEIAHGQYVRDLIPSEVLSISSILNK